MEKIFYQDFLFKDMEFDQNEYPNVQLEYAPLPKTYKKYQDRISYKNRTSCLAISFNQLLLIKKLNKWEKLKKIVKECSSVYIIDDVPIVNEELKSFKEFYLKSYFFTFKRLNNDCYISI